MSGSDCIRYTRSCMFGDCGQDAAYVLYEYLGNYRWSTDEQVGLFYACPKHVEQLAAIHRITAADIHEYNDRPNSDTYGSASAVGACVAVLPTSCSALSTARTKPSFARRARDTRSDLLSSAIRSWWLFVSLGVSLVVIEHGDHIHSRFSRFRPQDSLGVLEVVDDTL